MRPARTLLISLAVVLPGLVMLPVWSLGGFGPNEDDILYYLPSRVQFADFVQHGQWPWLSEWTGMDRPYLADPQSAVFYPPTWLFAVLPAAIAYPAALWLHYSIAFLGMARLLENRRQHYYAVVLGACAFAFCGFLLAHRAHFAMMQATAWTPWVFYRLERYTRDGGGRRLTIAAAVCAVQCLAGHVQIAAITALGSLVFLLADVRASWQTGIRWAAAWFSCAGLIAIQLLPTLMYLRECTRTHQTYVAFTENSWNPISLIGFVLPMWFGQRTPNFFDTAYWGPSHQVEQFAYAGILPLVLAVFALVAGWREPSRRGWAVLLAFALLLAFGIFGPICPLLYWIPGASVFRVPARAMLLVNLAIAALAANTMHELASPLSPARVRLRALVLRWTRSPVMVAVVVVVALVAPFLIVWPFAADKLAASLGRTIRPWNPAIWVPFMTLLMGLVAIGVAARDWRQPVRLVMLIPLTLLDLAIIGWTIDVPSRWQRWLLDPWQSPGWVSTIDDDSRLWVVTTRENGTPGEYIVPLQRCVANTNVLRGVRALTDYGPLQARAYFDRFGFRPWGECEQPDPLLSDTSWMPACDVGWVLLTDLERPAPVGGELVRTTMENWRLYRMDGVLGPAFVTDAAIPHAIRTTRESPYAFTTTVDFWQPTEASTNATARIVATRLALSGWSTNVNGQIVPTAAYDDLLLSVDVPARGLVEIQWRYFPPGLWAGLWITLLTAAILFGMGLIDQRTSQMLIQSESATDSE